jgi:CRISPR-associated protein Cas1
MGNSKQLEFVIPDIKIKRSDNAQVRHNLMSIDPDKRKKLKISKSTLWYQQTKIREGKAIKIYNKTKVRIE